MLMTKLPNKLKLIISRQFGKNIWEITEILNLFRNELEAREKIDIEDNLFFFIWVFFHEHSRFTGQQGKGEGIYLTPLYHFHPLYRRLGISRAITAESSPLRVAGSRTRAGNLWFPSASR